MDPKMYSSSQEMLNEVLLQEVVGMFDDVSTETIYQAMEKHEDEIDADRRLKTAKSIEDLSRIYITR